MTRARLAMWDGRYRVPDIARADWLRLDARADVCSVGPAYRRAVARMRVGSVVRMDFGAGGRWTVRRVA